MTTIPPINGITLRESTLECGGWACNVCHRVTRIECLVITRDGPRWLPCCSVGCYAHLHEVDDKWRKQQNDWLFAF